MLSEEQRIPGQGKYHGQNEKSTAAPYVYFPPTPSRWTDEYVSCGGSDGKEGEEPQEADEPQGGQHPRHVAQVQIK